MGGNKMLKNTSGSKVTCGQSEIIEEYEAPVN